MELCFATNNTHKLEEVAALLGDAFTLKTLSDIGCTEELAETTGTIAGNSRQKADYVYKTYGISCFADDSGLEVDALGGEPGVDSAYYSGTRDAGQNMALLLANLTGKASRKARFISVITLVLLGVEHQFRGVVEGVIVDRPRGTDGFGYDPIFQPEGYNQTFGELPADEKNKISHRARAVEQLAAYLKEQTDF